MPIKNFDDDCFVAFTDISGFKEMMKHDQQAVDAIGHLYTSGFNALRDNPNINGLFVSDCGILFTRDQPAVDQVKTMLEVLERLNRDLLMHQVMLTTSIAWGHFSYHSKIEFPGISKQPIYGNAYVSAFLDNETGTPRIQPGHCRIVTKNLPPELIAAIGQNGRVVQIKNHHYFYWMVNNSTDIPEFNRRYNDSYRLKYTGMLNALQNPGG